MKRFLILLGFLVSFQGYTQLAKEFAIKAGTNLTNFGDVNGLVGYELGISYKRMFSEKMALELGFNVRNQSMLENIKAIEADLSANFLSLPIGARFYINEELYLRVGVQTNLIANARIDENADHQLGENTDLEEYFNFVHLNTFGSIGYTLDKTIDFQFEYNYGLTDKFIEPSIARNTEGNNYFTLSIGWIVFKE